MNRWHLRKFFNEVSLAEFKSAIDAMKTGMEKSCGAIDVKVTAYDALKESITSWDDFIQACLDERNEEKVIATVNADELNDTLWKRAVYIEATLSPVDPALAPDSAFGNIEAKGLLSRVMNFYVQSDDHGDSIQKDTNTPFKYWIKGDGMQSNHIVTYS